MATKNQQIGECEASGCANPNDVWVTPHYNPPINFCASCWEKEKKVDEARAAKLSTANQMVKSVERQLERIEVVQDIFNASTLSIRFIQDTVNNDPTVSPQEKLFTICNLIKAEIEHLQPLIDQHTRELLSEKNHQYALQTNLRELASTLQREQQEKLRIEYPSYTHSSPKPATVRKAREAKPAKVRTRTATNKEIKEAAEKYGVELRFVSAYALQFKMSAEEAAQKVASMTKGN